MKKVLIGGFFSLIGSIWTLGVMLIAGNNLASSWSTPPGRFLTTVAEMKLMFPFIASVVLIILGIAVMMIELFSNGK